MHLEIKKSRKLQGWKYSCLVSIPRTWLDMHKLDKGDQVSFTILDDGSLLIKPYAEEKNETAAA